MNNYRYILLLVLMTGLALLALSSERAEAASQIDVYHFEDEAQRQRYKALIDEFRCPKCINTNLSGSDAPIAQDLRRTVHRLVVEEGNTDQQVRDFLQARYGDFVLYDPPFNERTWLIWAFPAAILGIGVVVLLRLLRSGESEVDLDDDQRAQVRQIMTQRQGEAGE